LQVCHTPHIIGHVAVENGISSSSAFYITGMTVALTLSALHPSPWLPGTTLLCGVSCGKKQKLRKIEKTPS